MAKIDKTGIDAFELDAFFMVDADQIERPRQPTAQTLMRQAKLQAVAGLKKETLSELVQELPKNGFSLHVVSNGRFDYFNFIPLVVGFLGTVDEMYGSTWTMNYANAKELVELFDGGKIGRLSVASGNYFKRRESAVYSYVVSELMKRKQRFCCWENHSKIMLMKNEQKNAWIVIEGSANWTANPRTEQNVIVNDRGLYEFHREWLEGMFKND